MDEKFYTVDELAKEWGVHRSTVVSLILRQKLGAVVIGKQYRISEQQLEDYYKANTIERKPNS